ncbi:MAG: M4 family metallopeptidase [Vicingus serpentipes]|nr:M4 family metallopeptidase [Vicingus serpentipes]
MRKYSLLLVLSFFSLFVFSQSTLLLGSQANTRVENATIVRLSEHTNVPNYVKFNKGKEIPFTQIQNWLSQFSNSKQSLEMRLMKMETDFLGHQHYRYQQVINGVPVQLATYIVHVKNGLVYAVNGNFYSNTNLTTNVQLAESVALEKALNHINAELYKWQINKEETHLKLEQENPNATYFPKGELVYINDKAKVDGQLVLAYRFNIYAEKPHGRKEVYVSANSGAIVWEENKIHEADVVGTANTGYSGTQTITCDDMGGGVFRLRETGRGNGIRTFNNGNTTNYSNTDFTNNSVNWTTFTPAIDAYATDAHWGAEMTYDYFLNEHGRNSIDDNGFRLDSYIHHDDNYANAFWDGQRMTYGDGNGNNSPFTALDIAGHEITHGLTSMTANLVYQDESGALNESFSDIFGTSIEYVARPSQSNWNMGEDLGGTGLRNMANPKSKGDPDTYFGTNWAPLGGADNGGVHTNSGVQNFWFVLLTDGGTGTNDNGDTYTVNGLGLTKASQIAFRNLTVYLTSNSNYADARFYSIQAAVDLFGACSPEVEAVTNAWYAVGVGQVYSPNAVASFEAEYTTSCSAPFTVDFTNTSLNGITFTWDFGDGNSSSQLSPSHTYTTYGDFDVKLHVDGGSSCGVDSIIKVNFVEVDSNLPCITILPTQGTYATQTSCSGTIYDSGGPSNKYGANEDATITIAPTGATSVDLDFTFFDVEPGDNGTCNFDRVRVYDGANPTPPFLIGTFCNLNTPTQISSTLGAITIVFHSDQAAEHYGFEINWQCQNSNQPPVANFMADVDTTCTGEVNFTDLSLNIPTSWLWDFGDGDTSTQKNPTHIYTTNGLYTVQLTSTNGLGNDDTIKTNVVFVDLPTAPAVQGDSICPNLTANLTASGAGVLNWYNAPTGGSLINTGTSYTTPTLTTTTTYYVEDFIEAPTQNIGKTDNTGSGSNFNNNEQYLIFDVYQPIEIIDVQVYAGAAGDRTVELRDDLGLVLASKTVNINSTGKHTLKLNFNVPVGNDFQLGLATNTPVTDLYRNDGGVNYPYTLSGMASITKSSASVNGGLNHYYFMYDWRVKGVDCISARIPVEAKVDCPTGIGELSAQGINIYPNPVNDVLTIEGLYNNSAVKDKGYRITNLLGEVVLTGVINSNKQTVNTTPLTKGVYFIQLNGSNSVYKFLKY